MSPPNISTQNSHCGVTKPPKGRGKSAQGASLGLERSKKKQNTIPLTINELSYPPKIKAKIFHPILLRI